MTDQEQISELRARVEALEGAVEGLVELIGKLTGADVPDDGMDPLEHRHQTAVAPRAEERMAEIAEGDD